VAETERLNSTYRRKFKAKWLSLSSHALGLFALSLALCVLRVLLCYM